MGKKHSIKELEAGKKIRLQSNANIDGEIKYTVGTERIIPESFKMYAFSPLFHDFSFPELIQIKE